MMDRSRSIASCASLVLMLLVAVPGRAQHDWDPARYTELSQEGQRLFEEAMAVTEQQEDMRQSLFFEAATNMKSALAMIRVGFASGAVDEEREAALQDYFTLMENLIVVWMHLDECWPAERLWTDATEHPGLSSRLRRDLFEPLSPRIRECRTRAPLWDWFAYHSLVEDAEQGRMLAPTSPDPGQTLTDATRQAREALRMMQTAVFDGSLRESPVVSPPDELMTRYRMAIELLIELGDCDSAENLLFEAQRDAEVLLQLNVGDVVLWREDVEDCEPAEIVVVEEEEEVERILSVREGVGYALVGASAIMIAGVFILDATSSSDRDELERLQDQCAVGPCDYSRATRLANDIDNTKLMAGVLLGGAVVTGTVALVLLLTGRDDESPSDQAAIAPVIGADGFGAVVRFTY